MNEMEDALRSCMEQLVTTREDREQIIVEAASEISFQQKRVRDLQYKLEDANKKAAKLAAENNSLCKAIDVKDKLVRELNESKAASDGKLDAAKAKLDAAQKHSASLQYEVRMLQKELEIRSQEREYDLKSVDAARAQQAENLKKIAQLEAECQRLRTMVRKRLPGPAAVAKMRDEVEQPAATPRRPRSVTPMSPRSVTPMSPRSVTPSPRSVTPMSPRRASEPERAVKLRAIEDENKVLKQMLAKRNTELQSVQMKYADEACKLSVVQRQLEELREESKLLSDANGQSESWAAALMSELEQFRAGKQGASSVMVSDMSLLDDFAEIEKLETESGDQATRPSDANKRSAPPSSAKKEESRSVTSEKNGEDPGSVSSGHPEWVQDVWKFVTHKHEATGQSIDAILQEIRRGLDQSTGHAKTDSSDLLFDQSKIEKIFTSLLEKITSLIQIVAADNVARSEPLLHEKSEFCARLEYLVQICHDVLQENAKVENFLDEVCLVLEYIVSEYCSNKDRPATVDNRAKNFDRDESPSTVNEDSVNEHVIQGAKSTAAPVIQTEAHEEPIRSAGDISDQILVSHQEGQLNEELAGVILDQDDCIQPGRKSAYYDIESPFADGMAKDLSQQEEKQLASNLEISAAVDKLAECQETITNLSKQLQVLKAPANSGMLDISLYNGRPSSVDYKVQSLASILAQGEANTDGSGSPTPKQVRSKKEHSEPDAASERRTAQAKNPETYKDAHDEEPKQIVVHPVFTEPRRDNIHADLKKKKRSPSLLGRIIFRKKVEDTS